MERYHFCCNDKSKCIPVHLEIQFVTQQSCLMFVTKHDSSLLMLMSAMRLMYLHILGYITSICRLVFVVSTVLCTCNEDQGLCAGGHR